MGFSYRAVLGAAFTQAWRCRKYPGKRRRDAFWRVFNLTFITLFASASAGLFLAEIVLHADGRRSTGEVLYGLLLLLVYAVLVRFIYSVAAHQLGDSNDKLPR